MNDNDVIKADELISRLHKYVFVYKMQTGNACGFTDSDFDFLHDFINCQKATIKEFDEKIVMQMGLIKYQKEEIDRLTVELQAMRGSANSYKIHYEDAQAEIQEGGIKNE